MVIDRSYHRIMDNHPGPGWYWEIIDNDEIVIPDTHAHAFAEVLQAEWEAAHKKAS